MAFEKPTLNELGTRIAADIEPASGEKASGRGDIYYPFARALTGIAHGLHMHLDYNRDQLFDATADEEHLVKRAADMGIYRTASQRAAGTATVPGNDGIQILEGEVLAIGELLYVTTEPATVTGGSATLPIRALDAGATGNQPAGTTLRLQRTIDGVDTNATVVELAGGADIEDIERLRERLQERRQRPPMGGRPSDYVQWAKTAHPDVTRAWCFNNEDGAGTVVVRVVTDDLDSRIPSQAHMDAVTEYIDAERPAGMAGYRTGWLVEVPIDIQFTYLFPDNQDVRDQIEAELLDLIANEVEPGKTLPLSRIRAAISSAAGEQDHTIDLDADIPSASHELLALGTITWPA